MILDLSLTVSILKPIRKCARITLNVKDQKQPKTVQINFITIFFRSYILKPVKVSIYTIIAAVILFSTVPKQGIASGIFYQVSQY